MTTLMFETFNVDKLFVVVEETLALYASGRTTGVVLSSGERSGYSVPIYEGYPLPHAIRKMDFGGRNVTQQLRCVNSDSDNQTCIEL